MMVKADLFTVPVRSCGVTLLRPVSFVLSLSNMNTSEVEKDIKQHGGVITSTRSSYQKPWIIELVEDGDVTVKDRPTHSIRLVRDCIRAGSFSRTGAEAFRSTPEWSAEEDKEVTRLCSQMSGSQVYADRRFWEKLSKKKNLPTGRTSEMCLRRALQLKKLSLGAKTNLNNVEGKGSSKNTRHWVSFPVFKRIWALLNKVVDFDIFVSALKLKKGDMWAAANVMEVEGVKVLGASADSTMGHASFKSCETKRTIGRTGTVHVVDSSTIQESSVDFIDVKMVTEQFKSGWKIVRQSGMEPEQAYRALVQRDFRALAGLKSPAEPDRWSGEVSTAGGQGTASDTERVRPLLLRQATDCSGVSSSVEVETGQYHTGERSPGGQKMEQKGAAIVKMGSRGLRKRMRTSEQTKERIRWIVAGIAIRGSVSERTAFRAFRAAEGNWLRALELLQE